MTLATIIILALAAFRITRLFAADSLTVGLRDRLFRFAYDENPEAIAAWAQQLNLLPQEPQPAAAPRAAWRTWAYELYTCQWCLGVWISIAVYCAWRWGGSVAEAVLVVAAVAGAQGSLAAFVGTTDPEPPTLDG